MIYDYHGTPLKRTIGFIGGFIPVVKILPVIGALILVGFEVPLEDEDDDD